MNKASKVNCTNYFTHNICVFNYPVLLLLVEAPVVEFSPVIVHSSTFELLLQLVLRHKQFPPILSSVTAFCIIVLFANGMLDVG